MQHSIAVKADTFRQLKILKATNDHKTYDGVIQELIRTTKDIYEWKE